MKINKLEWDTQFFGKNIGEIFLQKNDALNFETENLDLIVVKQTEKFEVKIPNYRKTFEETKVIFSKKLNTESPQIYSEIKDTDLEEKDLNFFKPLAYESGKQSRFLLDYRFGEEKFQKLYDEWIINSLNKKFAIKVFYIEEKEIPVGFVTIQQSGSTAKIGLIATNSDFQGKGYGRKLLEFSENFSLKNGMCSMEIPTQKENVQACNFYHKLGYQIKEELIIKHLWKI